MKRTLFLLLLLVSTVAPALAQDEATPSEDGSVALGLIGWGTMNLHRGDFTSYDGILECGTFDEAQTVGWGAGYLVDLPFSQTLALSGRLYYWKGDGNFTTPNPTPTRIAVDEQTVVPLETNHRLETDLDYIMVDLLAKWKIASPLYLAAGPSIGYGTRAAYEQEEEIVSPQGVTFINGASTRNIIAGNFDEQGTLNTRRLLRLAATGIIGADIPLTDRLTLTPEAGISWGFTSVLSSFDWKVHAIRVGAGITYAIESRSAPSPDTVLAAPPNTPAPQPVVVMNAFNQQGGVTLNYAEIAIAEERGTDLIPLLPYVFFDPNSSTIPSRYHRLSAIGNAGFSEDNLRDSTLGVYHDLLNIIGSRMRRYPDATITVTGCREPLEDSNATDQLSAERASAVRNYLTTAWNIAPSRITLESRALPQEISNRSVADGRQENRRAEIHASDPRILAPVVRKLGGLRVDPEAVVLQPEIQFGKTIAGWRLSMVSDHGRELWSREGDGEPERNIAWQLPDDLVDMLTQDGSSTETVTAQLTAATTDGKTIVATRDIPVRRSFSSRRYSGEVVQDSLVERYSLIFFDFNTPEISDFNNDAIQLIRNRMRTSSSVAITGLTDRIGEENYNQDLSKQRAVETAKHIRTRIVPEQLKAEGAGEEFIFNNDLPEGRMYNRTVIVEIATPVEDI